MRLLLALTAATAALAAAATPAVAAAPCDRVAAPSGSDRAAGTQSAPYRTAPRLVDALRPGETGCLRGGTYDRTHNGYIARFGRRGPITLRSFPGERAQLVGTTMVAHGADRVRLSGLDFVGTGEENTVKIYAADVVVEDSDITNLGRGESCMILGSGSGGRAVRPHVRRNRFHECGAASDGNKDHGIYVAMARGGEIVDNVIVNPAAYAIQLYPDARRLHVARNVIDGGPDSVRGGIVIGGDGHSASRNNVVERNIISHTATGGVTGYWPGRRGRGNIVRDNCTWAVEDDSGDGGLLSRGNVMANPGFLDRARGDYRLAADSRCLQVVGAQVRAAAAAAGG